jgi:hypothetical protein
VKISLAFDVPWFGFGYICRPVQVYLLGETKEVWRRPLIVTSALYVGDVRSCESLIATSKKTHGAAAFFFLRGLFGYFCSMWIRVDLVGLRCILTWYVFKPTQCHSIHMDSHQNEQALQMIVCLPSSLITMMDLRYVCIHTRFIWNYIYSSAKFGRGFSCFITCRS